MQDKSFDEFLKDIKNVNAPRVHKISGSIGVIDGLKYYRANRPSGSEYVVDQHQYLSIIRSMNNMIADSIVNNKSFKLPSGFGVIEVLKIESKSWIDDDDKLNTTKPINMSETLKLWYEDEESRNNRTYVRYDNDYTFRIKYNKRRCNYKNNMYFDFSVCRSLKIKLKDAIVKGGYDSYELRYQNFSNNEVD